MVSERKLKRKQTSSHTYRRRAVARRNIRRHKKADLAPDVDLRLAYVRQLDGDHLSRQDIAHTHLKHIVSALLQQLRTCSTLHGRVVRLARCLFLLHDALGDGPVDVSLKAAHCGALVKREAVDLGVGGWMGEKFCGELIACMLCVFKN